MKMNDFSIENFLNNVHFITSSKLKKKLFAHNLKEEICESCKHTEWMGRKISLELHHIDGNPKNNNLSNLMILCPNCHALTEHYRGSNQKRKREPKTLKTDEEFIIAIKDSYSIRQALLKLGLSPFGSNYTRAQNICTKYGICFRPMNVEEKALLRSKRSITTKTVRSVKIADNIPFTPRVEREKLLQLLWSESTLEIGRIYGVSGNAVKKWAKHYKLPSPPSGYWSKFKHNHEKECAEIKRNLFLQFNLV
jgi:hypothetical protein